VPHCPDITVKPLIKKTVSVNPVVYEHHPVVSKIPQKLFGETTALSQNHIVTLKMHFFNHKGYPVKERGDTNMQSETGERSVWGERPYIGFHSKKGTNIGNKRIRERILWQAKTVRYIR
jgi:hypothetical protein